MKITDAAVCPYPDGDSSVRRMALEARALGFDSLVAFNTPTGEYTGIAVRRGIHIPVSAIKDVIGHIKRAKESDAVVSVQAGDNGFNRTVICQKGIHILRGIQSADKTAFDHVAAQMAADNHVAIDLDLSVIITGRGIMRQRAMQRYRDILVLERRFEFPLTLSSYARSILDMRAVREITGLCSLVGMDIPDVEKALSGVGMVTTPPNPTVKVIR